MQEQISDHSTRAEKINNISTLQTEAAERGGPDSETDLQLTVLKEIGDVVDGIELSDFLNNDKALRIAQYDEDGRQKGFNTVKIVETEEGDEGRDPLVTYIWEDGGGMFREASIGESVFKALYADSVVDSVARVATHIGEIDDPKIFSDILLAVSPELADDNDEMAQLEDKLFTSIARKAAEEGSTDIKTFDLAEDMLDAITDETLAQVDLEAIVDGEIYDRAIEYQSSKNVLSPSMAKRVAGNVGKAADSIRGNYDRLDEADKKRLKKGTGVIVSMVARELLTRNIGSNASFMEGLQNGDAIKQSLLDLAPDKDASQTENFVIDRVLNMVSDAALGVDYLREALPDEEDRFGERGKASTLLRQFATIIGNLPNIDIPKQPGSDTHSIGNTAKMVRAVVSMNKIRRDIEQKDN